MVNVNVGEWGALGMVLAVSAPLLLATNGGRRAQLTAMPYATSSSFAPTKRLLELAHKKAIMTWNQLDKSSAARLSEE